MVFWINLQYNFPTLPIAPAETMRPFCVPALLVLLGVGWVKLQSRCCVRGGPIPHFGRFGLDFSYLK